MEEAGLYVHVPFCRNRCGYCAFTSSDRYGRDGAFQARYVSALLAEFRARLAGEARDLRFRTLYLGGGTPSLLGEGALRALLAGLRDAADLGGIVEASSEANPEDLLEDPGRPGLLVALGFTRLSVGLQTLDPRGLAALGRRARPEQAWPLAEALARDFPGAVGFDLILGWPGQDGAGFERHDLDFLRRAPFVHLSAYHLGVEPGTPLARNLEAGRSALPAEEEVEDWQAALEAALGRRGFAHYEISNHALPGSACRHNQNTWRGLPYLGLGCGAVSRVGERRWRNLDDPGDYAARALAGIGAETFAERLTPDIRWREELMLGLRAADGVGRSGFAARHGFDPVAAAGPGLGRWLAAGWLLLEGDRVRLSPRGWRVSDAVISDWWLAAERAAPAAGPVGGHAAGV